MIDAARRAAYDQLRAVPAPPAFPAAPVVPRRRSAARAGEVPRRAKEAWASGPKEAQKPEAEDAEDISAKPAKHQELLKKLLKKTRKEMFSELQALSEEALRAFASFLESWNLVKRTPVFPFAGDFLACLKTLSFSRQR